MYASLSVIVIATVIAVVGAFAPTARVARASNSKIVSTIAL